MVYIYHSKMHDARFSAAAQTSLLHAPLFMLCCCNLYAVTVAVTLFQNGLIDLNGGHDVTYACSTSLSFILPTIVTLLALLCSDLHLHLCQ